ncbi:Uncharacterised protein [Vibrio cholerae]|nr:Uncharacterised protein [Vibrio cholerae]
MFLKARKATFLDASMANSLPLITPFNRLMRLPACVPTNMVTI